MGKFRCGFVTNSSSSSFVLSDGMFSCISEIYEYIIECYRDIGKNLDKSLELAVEYGIIDDTDNKLEAIKYLDELSSNKIGEKHVINTYMAKAEMLYGFDSYTYELYLDGEYNWIDECDTYAKFLAKFGESAPFKIIDHENIDESLSGDYSIMEMVGWFSEETGDKEYLDVDIVNNYKDMKRMALKFGRYCVYSECGNIPNCVVSNIADISAHWCNHMG